MKKIIILEGLDCPNCAEKIKSETEKIDLVSKVSMNFMAKKLSYHIPDDSDGEIVLNNIKKMVKALEPDVKVILKKEENGKNSISDSRNKIMPIRIIVSFILLIISIYYHDFLKSENQTAILAITGAAYILIGWDIVLKAVKNIFRGKIFDENFLMTVATIGAFFIGKFPEAVAVMLFYQTGEMFQSYAVRKSRNSISELMNIRPDFANVKNDSKVLKVNPEEVKINDIILVKAGEKIPLDGEVVSGYSSIDTSALTGESIPRDVSAGSQVISGCINQSGLLEIKVTKLFAESTVAKILDLVENASSKKASAENFITKFSKWYTPIVVILAVLLAVLPPIILGDPFSQWIYRGLSFLVISCPCALVVSIPLSFFGGIGGASKLGILVKGGNYLEVLANCTGVIFDKTGTLTEGQFQVTQQNAIGITNDELIYYAAIAEHNSNHPIAQSIKNKYSKNEELGDIYSEELAGRGIKAVYNSKTILAGNLLMMNDNDIFADKTPYPGTVVHVAVDGEYAGNIVISDKIKPDAMLTINALKNVGIERIAMLTGDNETVAKEVAGTLGISEYYANLLPDKKVEILEDIISKKKSGEQIAFVGDGINDAPVLARADLGIAMGALGSDAAIEAADIVLMDDQPSKIAAGKKIAQKSLRIVKQNIIFALGTKILVLILVALGLADMWPAVFADVGVTFIAVLNAVRCLNVSKLKKQR